MTRPLKNARSWVIEDRNGDSHYVNHYADEVSDLVNSLEQDALDWGDTEYTATVIPLVPHDPAKEGELRRLRSFVRRLAALYGEPFDAPADVIEAFAEEAKDLIVRKGKGKKKR